MSRSFELQPLEVKRFPARASQAEHHQHVIHLHLLSGEA
ncbi:Hypothetical protein A7982_07024 [Minicystis rosea]|nr:Hypothetical protein A7982_07024 [Minicystis rosea]